jgi:hypothetical protein
MDTPIVLLFNVRPAPNTTSIRSLVLKEYFSTLTSNVEVLYPTQVHHGLLMCKSRRSKFVSRCSCPSLLPTRTNNSFRITSRRENHTHASCSCRWFIDKFVVVATAIVRANQMSNPRIDHTKQRHKHVSTTMFAISSCFR